MAKPNRAAKSIREVATNAPAVQGRVSEEEVIKDRFKQAWQTLTNIEKANSPTNAQVVSAIRFMASNQKDIMRYLARQVSE